ncbi:hypothetical protein H4R33_001699 [Dimargaris cristalligena]|nr:hypothetical protein H4R33_001699 [Dimargaris cristalligena]
MSGGVDSSVALYFLKQQGYTNLEAVYMRNWDTSDEQGVCPSELDYQDVQAVCRQLGIPHHRVNFTRQYWNDVFAHTLQAYGLGHTPNPDILCNREIKFGALLQYCRTRFATPTGGPPPPPFWIATGHYARVLFNTPAGEEGRGSAQGGDGLYQLARGIDPRKDQSYYLSALRQDQLAHILFPLGNYTKPEIRTRAQQAQLLTAHKQESMGICFVGKRRRFADFLAEYIPERPGDILTVDGQVVGQHQGLFSFTVGQCARVHHGPHRWFVYHKDIPTNTIRVVAGRDHPLLFTLRITGNAPNWVAGCAPDGLAHGLILEAQVRYHQTPAVRCWVRQVPGSANLDIEFLTPVRGVAPGQYIVFYSGSICLGNARIDTPADQSTLKNDPFVLI